MKNPKPLPLNYISGESPLLVNSDYLRYSRHFLVRHNWDFRVVYYMTVYYTQDFLKYLCV